MFYDDSEASGENVSEKHFLCFYKYLQVYMKYFLDPQLL